MVESWDPESQTFTFKYLHDLAPLDFDPTLEYKDYVIKVKATGSDSLDDDQNNDTSADKLP